MKWKQIDTRYLVKGEPGDRLPDLLTQVALEMSIASGSVTGIGGVKRVELAYFDLDRREYLSIQPEGVVELVSLAGNLAWVDGRPFWHLHAVVSDRNGQATAGHLVSLEVAVTLECWIVPGSVPVNRRRDEYTGLNLLEL